MMMTMMMEHGHSLHLIEEDKNMDYELIIIGGGPAGCSAGVYAGRKELKTLLITEEFGGQSIASEDVKNWIGDKSISGLELAKKLEGHLREYSDIVDIKKTKVEKIEKITDGFFIKTSDGDISTKTILMAIGSSRRKLDIPGAEEFENKGVVYCASCDGPLFKDKNVVVVGGGNAGFETAAQLMAYAKSVTILQRSDRFKADAITVNKVLENERVTGLLNVDIKEIQGDTLINSVTYLDKNKNEEIKIPAEGVFVEIGMVPNTDVIDFVEKDNFNRIKIDCANKKSSVDGIWAAGDCTDSLYHQNNIAAGDAIIALENIYLYLKIM